MTLQPTIKNDWERILVMGGAGSGKTTSWLNISKWAQQTNSPCTFYVIDTDRTVPRMLGGQYAGVRVETYPATDWDEYDTALNDILKLATPDDWIIVDMIGPAWDAVQAYFTEEVFNKDIGNYFLEVRRAQKDPKQLEAFKGWTDWQVINALYKSWIKRLLFRSKSHVLCCTPAESVSRDTDSAAMVNLFGRFGCKPVGQKQLAFQFNTLLLTEQKKDGSYIISSIKDRERPDLVKVPMTEFTDTYLLGVAGWKI